MQIYINFLSLKKLIKVTDFFYISISFTINFIFFFFISRRVKVAEQNRIFV